MGCKEGVPTKANSLQKDKQGQNNGQYTEKQKNAKYEKNKHTCFTRRKQQLAAHSSIPNVAHARRRLDNDDLSGLFLVGRPIPIDG